jgi:hypothetical protein
MEQLMDENEGVGGDPGWIQSYRELLPLHLKKSATYGTDEDKLANFTEVGEITHYPEEYYVALRIIEKLRRAVNMIERGDENDVKEWPDCASLALCGEALRRRRIQ